MADNTAKVNAWKRRLGNHRKELICAALLLLMGFTLIGEIRRKSLTNDEFYNIPAGYYNLVARDFGINNVHPPLIRMIAALPLLPLHLQLPPRQPSEDAIAGGHATFAAFWFANLERMEQIAFWSRVPMIGLALLLGVTIFMFARRLFGPRAAVMAVLLFVLEPTMLAHGRLVQTDVPAALGYLFFCYMLYRYASRPTVRDAMIAGLACGLAVLTKSSLIVTVPVFGLVLLVLLWRAPVNGQKRTAFLTQTALALLALILIINASYFFQRAPLEVSDTSWIAAQFPHQFPLIMASLSVSSRIVPAYFVFVFYVVAAINKQGWPASLWGMYSRTGWWYYFPVAFALKTTIPFLLVSLSSLGWFSWELIARKKTELLWLIGPPVIYAALTMSSNINIGVRHFLPVFPFLFILGGVLLDRLLNVSRRGIGIAVVALLVGWMAVESVRAFPNYLGYMNQLACRHPHWYYLSDSNVEWGDDVGELALYLRARAETRVSAAVLGGWLTLSRYGVEYVDAIQPAKSNEPQQSQLTSPRYVAIGASYLNGSTVPEGLKHPDGSPLSDEERHEFFATYRGQTPEAVFGNSIYLYRRQ
jgi:4-amino-4-deoxy-L-arabinose transferase-like glycosyltransferase